MRVIMCVIRRTFLPFFFSFLSFFPFFSGGVSLPWLATIHENLGFSVRRCAEHLKDWAEMAGAQGEAGKLGWRKCGWKPSDLIQGVIRNQASSSTATISFSCASEPCFQKLRDRELFFSFRLRDCRQPIYLKAYWEVDLQPTGKCMCRISFDVRSLRWLSRNLLDTNNTI